MDKDYFVVDFEFTQYTKPKGRPAGFFPEIIEIGAVKVDSDTNEITGHIQKFVKPHFYPNQAEESMVFCMIKESDMKDVIDFSTMLDLITELYIPGKTYFVAWGDADYGVVKQGCERHGLDNPILQEDYLDLAEAYKLWYDDDYTTGLRAAVEEQDIDTGGLWHTAYYDAANTSKVMQSLLSDGWTPETYFESIT